MKATNLLFLLALCFFSVTFLNAKSINNGNSPYQKDSPLEKEDKSLEELEEILIETIFGIKKSITDSIIAGLHDPELQAKLNALNSDQPDNLPDIYSFDKRILYRMNTEVENVSVSKDFTMLISSEEDYMGFQHGSIEQDRVMPVITGITDYDNDVVILISEKQKTAQVFSKSMLNSFSDNQDANREFTIEKSGDSKNILGYTCEEYILTSEQAEGSIWIAADLEIFNKSFFQSLAALDAVGNIDISEMQGLMMAMDMKLKSEGNEMSRINFNVISIMELKNQFAAADYKKYNMTVAISEK